MSFNRAERGSFLDNDLKNKENLPGPQTYNPTRGPGFKKQPKPMVKTHGPAFEKFKNEQQSIQLQELTEDNKKMKRQYTKVMEIKDELEQQYIGKSYRVFFSLLFLHFRNNYPLK